MNVVTRNSREQLVGTVLEISPRSGTPRPSASVRVFYGDAELTFVWDEKAGRMSGVVDKKCRYTDTRNRVFVSSIDHNPGDNYRAFVEEAFDAAENLDQFGCARRAA